MSRRVATDETIPVELKEVDELMHRYGQWARRRFRINSCGSMERRYKAPDWENAPVPVVLMAGWRAFEVQKIVQALPLDHRMVLWAQYDADDDEFAQRHCHRKGIRSRAQWMRWQIEGLRMLSNRLRGMRLATSGRN